MEDLFKAWCTCSSKEPLILRFTTACYPIQGTLILVKNIPDYLCSTCRTSVSSLFAINLTDSVRIDGWYNGGSRIQVSWETFSSTMLEDL